ncbi:MAG: leucyl aminopeptidase [Actinomycetota bacterium]|nr:leucyl aminopeptidase [Actinomycetota bacterium]
MPPEIVPSEESATEVVCDALVVAAYRTDDGFALGPTAAQVDEALDGYLAEHLEDIGFKAKVGDVASIATMRRLGAKTVVVAGLGPQNEVLPAKLRRAAGAAARGVAERGVIAAALHERSDATSASAVAEGFLLASYRYTTFKTDPHPTKIQRVLLLGASDDAATRGAAIGGAVLLARDLINEPAATLTPDALARRAQEVADVEGLECTVLEPEQIAQRGLNGVLSVAKGSDVPPRFIELRYRPENAGGRVSLVGKGVTFDSGGLSLKDGKNMETMKTDMSGAAAVIATMSVVKRLGIGLEVTAYIPAVENMPSGKALKPGDVITHYGGKTSEVLNTDAEGRLILADALAVAAEERPDAIVDVATLTGSIMIALGRDVAGLFSNDDALASDIEAAAEEAGEPLWRMPMYGDYRRQIDSEVADFKNIGTRYGGSIVAALFLQEFVPDDIPWAHLDIAGPARSESDDNRGPKGGTGVATRTLISFLEKRSR